MGSLRLGDVAAHGLIMSALHRQGRQRHGRQVCPFSPWRDHELLRVSQLSLTDRGSPSTGPAHGRLLTASPRSSLGFRTGRSAKGGTEAVVERILVLTDQVAERLGGLDPGAGGGNDGDGGHGEQLHGDLASIGWFPLGGNPRGNTVRRSSYVAQTITTEVGEGRGCVCGGLVVTTVE